MTEMMSAGATGLLQVRDAIAEATCIPARVLRDAAPAAPRLTIAIPTYRRLPLLVKAVRSAAAQGGGLAGQIEILVVDNDPASAGMAALLRAAPDLAHAPIRYLANDENVGMLPNWNRCIGFARGEWLTILNDDDLLDADFAATMLALVDRTGADGLFCCKRMLDQRTGGGEPPPEPLLTGGRRLIGRALFRGRPARAITARQMFWGNPAGNPVGFLAPVAAFRAMGGFYPENYPSADYLFFTRFALQFRLMEASVTLATIRVAENESMRPDVLIGFLLTEYYLQQALAGTVLPRWYARLSPWLVGYHVEQLERMWRVRLDRAVLDARLGVPHRPGRQLWLQAVRLLSGGF